MRKEEEPGSKTKNITAPWLIKTVFYLIINYIDEDPQDCVHSNRVTRLWAGLLSKHSLWTIIICGTVVAWQPSIRLDHDCEIIHYCK